MEGSAGLGGEARRGFHEPFIGPARFARNDDSGLTQSHPAAASSPDERSEIRGWLVAVVTSRISLRSSRLRLLIAKNLRRDGAEKFLNLAAQPRGRLLDLVGGGEHRCRGAARPRDAVRDFGECGDHGPGVGGGAGDALGNFHGRGVLLLDGAGDLRGVAVDLLASAR